MFAATNARSLVIDLVSTMDMGRGSAESRRDYLKQVMENKEVVRLTIALQGIILLVKPDVAKLLKVAYSHSAGILVSLKVK